VPLYYIEYGIEQIGALQLWRRFLDDPGEAVDCYRLGLSLGNTRTLPELFEATGIRFVFDSGTMRPLIDCIAGVLGVEEK
jgi:oligoendopeptidase F